MYHLAKVSGIVKLCSACYLTGVACLTSQGWNYCLSIGLQRLTDSPAGLSCPDVRCPGLFPAFSSSQINHTSHKHADPLMSGLLLLQLGASAAVLWWPNEWLRSMCFRRQGSTWICGKTITLFYLCCGLDGIFLTLVNRAIMMDSAPAFVDHCRRY